MKNQFAGCIHGIQPAKSIYMQYNRKTRTLFLRGLILRGLILTRSEFKIGIPEFRAFREIFTFAEVINQILESCEGVLQRFFAAFFENVQPNYF